MLLAPPTPIPEEPVAICHGSGLLLDPPTCLPSPLEEAAPVTTRQGKTVELTWTETANRLDDELHGNRDTKQIAEVACEKDQVQMLIPLKHPAQKANE